MQTIYNLKFRVMKNYAAYKHGNFNEKLSIFKFWDISAAHHLNPGTHVDVFDKVKIKIAPEGVVLQGLWLFS